MLKKLLPIIDSASHQTYIEPFGGSAAVLLNKKPSPVEIYNDIYGDVVNFFKVLREQPDQLTSAISLTPYSREEFLDALDRSEEETVERARKFFVTARQVMYGLATTATPGRWGVAHKLSRRGMALVVSRWLSSIDGLEEITQRLKSVIIENENALKVLKRYDSTNSLAYLDPPYPMETRTGGKAYAFEMSLESHGELLDLANSCKGKVAISSYPSDLYSVKLKEWNCIQFKVHACSTNNHHSNPKRDECLWINF